MSDDNPPWTTVIFYINTNKTLNITPTPTYTLIPNSQNIQFTTGSGNKYFEIQAPNNAPARYWAIRNTNNCSWLNWNSNPNSNADSDYNPGCNPDSNSDSNSNSNSNHTHNNDYNDSNNIYLPFRNENSLKA